MGDINALIDSIINEMMREILFEIYSHLPSSESFISDPYIGGFYISPEINPYCHWLASDCRFVYIVYFNDKKMNSASKYDNSMCYTLRNGIDRNSNSIHNIIIEQTFNINLNNLKSYNNIYVPEDYLKLRSNIRNELERIYKETSYPKLFNCIDVYQKNYNENITFNKDRKSDEDVNVAENLFFQDLNKMFYSDNFLDKNDEILCNVIVACYNKSPYYKAVWNVKMFFGKMIKQPNHII